MKQSGMEGSIIEKMNPKAKALYSDLTEDLRDLVAQKLMKHLQSCENCGLPTSSSVIREVLTEVIEMIANGENPYDNSSEDYVPDKTLVGGMVGIYRTKPIEGKPLDLIKQLVGDNHLAPGNYYT